MGGLSSHFPSNFHPFCSSPHNKWHFLVVSPRFAFIRADTEWSFDPPSIRGWEAVSLEERSLLCVSQGYFKLTLKGIIVLMWEAGNVSKGQPDSSLAQTHTGEPSVPCAAQGWMEVHGEELTASTELGSGMQPAVRKAR